MDDTGSRPGAQPRRAAPDDHPNLPARRPIFLAFAGIVLAGLLGGTIGWGLVRASCTEQPTVLQDLLRGVDGYTVATRSCTASLTGGAVGGAMLAAAGAGIVAVLVLRAMSEWRGHPPAPRPPASP